MKYYPPASKVSREVANLTERKNPHYPVYGVKRICLSVCMSVCSPVGLSIYKKTEILKFYRSSKS